MGLDIRLPIGLMFSLIGVLLTVFGLFGDKTIYQRSLAINVNLWWGIIMLIFGLAMLLLGLRGTRAKQDVAEMADE
jgi:multisubunit Na+/H+ antiporter MnhG subunit